MDPNQTSSSLPTVPAQPIPETPFPAVSSTQPASVPLPEPEPLDIASPTSGSESPVVPNLQETVTSLSETPELPKAPGKLLSAPSHHTSWGALAGIVIILIILVVAALYFWGAQLAKEDAQTPAPEASIESSDTSPSVPAEKSAQ